MAKEKFLSKLTLLDAQRLQKSVKATVQASGRLTFAMDAVKEMKLSEDRSIIILAADDGDLGAVISDKGDPEAFTLKKCGAYFYVSFKNFLQQSGVDYKNNRVIYDITELDEKYKGRTLYQFERRILPRGENEEPDQTESADQETPSATTETASVASEQPPPTPAAPVEANAPAAASAPSAVASTGEWSTPPGEQPIVAAQNGGAE